MLEYISIPYLPIYKTHRSTSQTISVQEKNWTNLLKYSLEFKKHLLQSNSLEYKEYLLQGNSLDYKEYLLE